MTAEKQVMEAVERAQAILARYVEPGERDCERTINDLLDVLDRDQVVAAVEELARRGEAVDELRRLFKTRAPSWSSPAQNSVEPDLAPMPPTSDRRIPRWTEATCASRAIVSRPASTPANTPTPCRK